MTLAVVTLLAAAATAEADAPLDETVVTATRHSLSITDYAGSADRISGDDVELVAPTHSSEVINRSAGSMIQRGSGEESLIALRSPVLTGGGACGAFLILEDSIPIRPIGFCNANELFEVDTEQAHAIEVLRGPGGALYGSNAMHGTINVFPADPAEMPALGVTVDGGSDQYWRGRVSTATHHGDADYGLAAVATHDGGWRDQSGFDEYKLNAEAVHHLDNGTLTLRFSGSYLDQDTAGFIVGRDAYKDPAIRFSNANPEAFREASSERATMHWEQPLSDVTTLDLRGYLRNSHMRFLQHFLLGKPLEVNGQTSSGFLLTFSRNPATGAQWTAGIDGEAAGSNLLEVQDAPTTGGSAAQNAIRPAGKHYDYGVGSFMLAPYGQLTLPFASRWLFTAGARFEHVSYEYDNHMIAGNTDENGVPCPFGGCLYNRPADRNDTFSNFAPKLSLLVHLTDRESAYVALARGFRAPEQTELYRLQRQQSVADLDSEQLDSAEIGLHGAERAIRYSLAAFYMEKRNVILRDANGFNVSNGRTHHRGIEFDADWRFTPDWTLSGAGTYAHHTYAFTRAADGGELIVDGNDVDTAPRNVGSARLEWRLADSVRTELEWVHVGSYFVDAANTEKYPGHDLLNLRAAWSINDAWTLRLRVNNLANVTYADRADLAFGNLRYFPGRDRSVFLEIGYYHRQTGSQFGT
ncbi:MAG TPA: TonB-dependent receptor [Steroidobacteraceae bacterium]|nr:TonB-dependent receptor [Steroidobacteraceae bacterium]